jgi:hypothetical protein
MAGSHTPTSEHHTSVDSSPLTLAPRIARVIVEGVLLEPSGRRDERSTRIEPSTVTQAWPKRRQQADTTHVHCTHAWLSTMPVTGLYM